MNTASLDDQYLYHLQTIMERTDRSLAELGFDALVIQAGAPPTQFLDDQDYPYKVNPHFKAWVPILDSPRSILVYRPGSRPRVLLNQPRDFWHKPAQLPAEAWTAAIDITPIEDLKTAARFWTGFGRVAFLGPAESAAVTEGAVLNDSELLNRLHYDRAVKTPYELECMRRASALGVLGHRAALAAFRDGGSEYDAHMHYLAACRQREEEMPYNNIVAYNENTAVLHYQHLERRAPRPLRSFLIDAGAQFRGYASDITRTYSAAGGLYSDLISATDRAQLTLCSQVVAGTDYRDIHLAAHRRLGDVLHEVGVTRVDGDTALEAGITSVFFPHGIGHLLGLQVHDVGGVQGSAAGTERERPAGHPYLRLTRMLEPGVVVTIEPGLYFIETLLAPAKADAAKAAMIDWTAVDALRPFGGIRIEDNVVATTSVPENMTRDAFAKHAA